VTRHRRAVFVRGAVQFNKSLVFNSFPRGKRRVATTVEQQAGIELPVRRELLSNSAASYKV
jgi:hypothetical protein